MVGYKVDYDTQIDNIRISDHIDQLRDLLPDHHSPFRKSNGYGNQGYLFPISNELEIGSTYKCCICHQ